MMKTLPTLRQLQFFDSLVRNKAFSRAADECCVSQSTLSAGIKELESVLGATLVDRSSKQFHLTPKGDEVANRALGVLAMAHELVRSVEDRPPLTGELRLGMIPTIGPFLLPLLMSGLKARYPDLKLFLREEMTETLVEGLRAGRIDIAVLAMPVETECLDTLIFAEDPFVFACPSDHEFAGRESLQIDALEGERLLLLEDGHCLRDHALSACRLQDRKSADAFGATSLLTLVHMVRSDVGTTLLPKLAVDQGIAKTADITTVPLLDEHGVSPSRDLGLAWRHGSGREVEARALAEVMAQVTPQPAPTS